MQTKAFTMKPKTIVMYVGILNSVHEDPFGSELLLRLVFELIFLSTLQYVVLDHIDSSKSIADISSFPYL